MLGIRVDHWGKAPHFPRGREEERREEEEERKGGKREGGGGSALSLSLTSRTCPRASARAQLFGLCDGSKMGENVGTLNSAAATAPKCGGPDKPAEAGGARAARHKSRIRLR